VPKKFLVMLPEKSGIAAKFRSASGNGELIAIAFFSFE